VEEAIAANQKALTLAPDFAPAHNNLTIAYLEKGDYGLAIEHCEKALAHGYDVAQPIRQEIEAYRAKRQS
jgi:tetratricopeptide (TPR) repeat protein